VPWWDAGAGWARGVGRLPTVGSDVGGCDGVSGFDWALHLFSYFLAFVLGLFIGSGGYRVVCPSWLCRRFPALFFMRSRFPALQLHSD
jgi:hypothetical protein